MSHGVDAELAVLRAEIDAIDDQVLSLLRARMAVVQRVGLWKAQKANGLCPIRSGREATQLRRVSTMSGELLPAAAAHIWRHMINASLAIEGRLAVSVTQDAETFRWSCEYFGSYTPHTVHATAAQVVADIATHATDVGVAPLSNEAWWEALAGTEVRVFAALPFIANASAPHTFAFARLHPEPSGQDVTLAIFSHKAACALPHTTLDTHGDKSLVALEGFITQDALPEAAIIGAYAQPLTLR